MFTSNYRREVLSLVKLWWVDGVFQHKNKQNTNVIERIQARFPHMQMKKDPLHHSEAAIENLSSKSRIYVYNTKILMKGHSWNAPNSTNLIGNHIFTSNYE